MFTLKLLTMHFNWFSYKLLNICSLFFCRFSSHIFNIFFVGFVGLLWTHLSWSFGRIYRHTHTHAHSFGIHARTGTRTRTLTHTQTRARAGDAKKAIEKFIVVVDSDAWFDSGAGDAVREEIEEQHVFFFFLSNSQLGVSYRFTICVYLLDSWLTTLLYYSAALLFLFRFAAFLHKLLGAVFETLDERQLSKRGSCRELCVLSGCTLTT